MSLTYHFHTDDLNESFLASIKSLFPHRRVEIVVMSLNDESSATTIGRTDNMEARPRFGSAQGKIRLSEDFNDEVEDFREYMP